MVVSHSCAVHWQAGETVRKADGSFKEGGGVEDGGWGGGIHGGSKVESVVALSRWSATETIFTLALCFQRVLHLLCIDLVYSQLAAVDDDDVP